MRKKISAGLLALCVATATASVQAKPAASAPARSFVVQGDQFLLDGKPFKMRTGEIHFQRVPRAHWRERMRMAKAMGLNTIGTYLFWNALEPTPGHFDFNGNNDIAEFVRVARQEGLWVLLRPGPYVCAEWEFGGFPSWLLKTPDMKVRTADPRFLAAFRNYLQHVGKQLAPLQVTHGGPILMTQVENEYGSFGDDKAYLNATRKALRDAGFDGVLYTVDGGTPEMLSRGSLPDVIAGANGSDGLPALAKVKPGQPKLVGEFYPGWFDHWGEPHHHSDAAKDVAAIEKFLSAGASFSIYMFHGGTNFGFMNGANYSDTVPYQPTTTSYDYDAPLDEAGRPTPKYFAMRDVIAKYLPKGEKLPDVPAAPKLITIPRFALTQTASLWSLLGKPVEAAQPLTFEALDQSYGFVLYRTTPASAATGMLDIDEVRDYALVSQGDRALGVLDRRKGEHALQVALAAGQPLDILVENMGRINYGEKMMDGYTGITHKVTLAGAELKNWRMYRLPLNDLSGLRFSATPKKGPLFWRGTFELKRPGDTYLDMRGWGKGHVWLNGHHLGRYWKIGPQQALYAPAEWFKPGRNELVVLEEHAAERHSVQGLANPVFDNPK